MANRQRGAPAQMLTLNGSTLESFLRAHEMSSVPCDVCLPTTAIKFNPAFEVVRPAHRTKIPNDDYQGSGKEALPVVHFEALQCRLASGNTSGES